MEITRNNIIVDSQSLLVFLSNLGKVNSYNYNCIDNTLSLDVFESWDSADDLVLDTGIAISAAGVDYLKIKIENVVIDSIREFTKKYRKEGSIKNKVQSYDYDKTSNVLIITTDDTWTTANTTTLDTILDNLVGYDVVTELMVGYETKEKDGHRYYNRKRSELVESIILAERTSAEAFEIDQHLIRVKESLLTGDWITAKTYLALTVVEGAYTQALKDEFNLEIQTYIDEKY